MTHDKEIEIRIDKVADKLLTLREKKRVRDVLRTLVNNVVKALESEHQKCVGDLDVLLADARQQGADEKLREVIETLPKGDGNPFNHEYTKGWNDCIGLVRNTLKSSLSKGISERV